MDPLFIGVDVGTESVRAGVFTERGVWKDMKILKIEVNNPEPGYYQQSSEEVWAAVCKLVKELVVDHSAEKIKAISFCATCSLVAIGKKEEAVSICRSENPKWNIVMWMDHRASAEAELINAMKHPVLSSVGGKISLEMQIPKILWLKDNLRKSSYDLTQDYFDLSDFLHWKATGLKKRSVCCLVCKWNFIYEPEGRCQWDRSFLEQFGLGDEECLRKCGSECGLSFPGDSDKISVKAAVSLGLYPSTKVGFSMIDAHAGLLGVVGSDAKPPVLDEALTSSLALICGTSNCVMALSHKPINVGGIWGPYYGVVLDQFYVAEGGQSAAGKLVDHVITTHPAYSELFKDCQNDHNAVLDHLDVLLYRLALSKQVDNVAYLTEDLHVWPDFHGNRSPVADPTLKGMVSGLTLSSSRNDLALIYLATLQALAYGIRHIKEALEKSGYKFNDLIICGGLGKSLQFRGALAHSTGIKVIVPDCPESVLLGAGISAAAAYRPNTKNENGVFTEEVTTLKEILFKMSGTASELCPNFEIKSYHDKKYKVFLRMLSDQQDYRNLMAD